MSSFYPLQNIINEAAKVPITISGIVIEYTSSITKSFLFVIISTTFRNVSPISLQRILVRLDLYH